MVKLDATVNTALDTLVGNMQSEALALVAEYLPIAGVLLVTIGVMFFGIRIFRAIARV